MMIPKEDQVWHRAKLASNPPPPRNPIIPTTSPEPCMNLLSQWNEQAYRRWRTKSVGPRDYCESCTGQRFETSTEEQIFIATGLSKEEYYKREMAGQVYSSRDLLRVRRMSAEADSQKNLRRKLKDKIELNDIVRAPGPSYRRLTRIPEEPRDTSVDKDKNLRPTSVRQLDGTDSEWKYRGRSESEDAQPQPISAPPGLTAQKDEGFQRFYRAVVSPTHVRVTAGGRIVPNNRTTFSPNPRWVKDKSTTEATPSHRAPIQGQAEYPSFQFPHVPLGPMPQMYAGFAPGPGMTPTQPPYAFVPWPMGMGMGMGGNFGIPMVPNPAAGTSPVVKKHRDATSSEQQSESGISEKTSGMPPLDFYDHTRSLFFNQQWMIPPGAPFYPMFPPPQGFSGMPGTAPTLTPAGSNRDVSTSKKVGHSMENKNPQRLSYSKTGAEGAAPHATPQANNTRSCPPISSIRPSEITKRHLDILRARLRYLEDQLQFNKHQIDERAVENDAQMARQFIQQFETNFEHQFHLEETQYPKTREPELQSSNGTVFHGLLGKPDPNNLTPATDGRKRTDYGALSQESSNSEAKYLSGLQSLSDTTTCNQALSGKPSIDKLETRFSSGINATRSVSAFSGFKPLAGARSGNEKSRLPLDAALAPPFQPRSDAALQNHDQTFLSSTKGVGKPGDVTEAADNARLSVLGEKVSYDVSKTPYAPHDNKIPYGVGQLPPWVGSERAQVPDVAYERELTEDELRARHMYWGKASHELQRGLPNFNDKRSYVPSSWKNHSTNGSMTRELPMQGAKATSSTFGQQPPVADPFKLLGQSGYLFSRDGPGNSTQSESLPGPEENLLRGAADAVRTRGTGMKRVAASLDGVATTSALSKLSIGESNEKSSGDECDDDRELIFRGRKALQQAGKTHNRIWSSMLNKGKSSAGAVPGTVSATTAQGVLPQYAGHATASLTPTIANKGASLWANKAKSHEALNIKANDLMQEHRGENCPPNRNKFTEQ